MLSATHLVIAAMDFTDDHFAFYADGVIGTWTQRWWGRIVARWANDVGWGPHLNARGDRYSWKYMHIYAPIDGVLESYPA